MKLSKIRPPKTIQLEVTKTEFNLINLALSDYLYFLENSLKYNNIYSRDELIPLAKDIKAKFIQQEKKIKPMLEIMGLFY